MLYYITHRGTGTRLYRSRRDAALLLTRYKTELEAGGQILIDYLWLPTSLEALIFCPFPIKEGSEVPRHLVLVLLAHLARMGRLWQPCALFLPIIPTRPKFEVGWGSSPRWRKTCRHWRTALPSAARLWP